MTEPKLLPETNRRKELKPCPFCGDQNPMFFRGREFLTSVICSNCKCQTEFYLQDYVAAGKWNARHPKGQPQWPEICEQTNGVYLGAREGEETCVGNNLYIEGFNEARELMIKAFDEWRKG